MREVEPWSVFTTLGNWYVSGYCRSAEAERVFRIDRIRSVERTGDSFEPVPAAGPATVRYTPSDDDTHVTIRLERSGRWVAEYYPVEVLDDRGDTMTIRMSVGDPAVAARLLVRLGPAARRSSTVRKLSGRRPICASGFGRATRHAHGMTRRK